MLKWKLTKRMHEMELHIYDTKIKINPKKFGIVYIKYCFSTEKKQVLLHYIYISNNLGNNCCFHASMLEIDDLITIIIYSKGVWLITEKRGIQFNEH